MKITKTKWFGDKIQREVQAAVSKSTLETAESVLKESNSKVPLDTGALMNSGEVVHDQNSAVVAYHEPYAAIVHEKPMDFQGGRQNKYLESSINNHASQFADNVKSNVGKALR
ncbi:hypothetical protein [Alkalihalobacterium chitinilyticum]|uniref:HK97 gp10 family phage protein n=1 Tax=Alkalihalobacterium chitinilyticum TaxID=2980103 RepID=A0ABT5VMI9_9BACI|nr:hypothetical protein [Alkalihalobacterium chitinilyticum]MDE5415484.1 hypothetical protein [Alkalihalobacterium chitinilyticum]